MKEGSNYVPRRGDALLIRSGPLSDPDRFHLHFICTNASREDDDHLLVPVVTWRRRTDDATCALNKRDHSFLRHRSFIMYQYPVIRGRIELTRGVRDGTILLREPASPELIDRVCLGILASPDTPPRFAKYYRRVG